MMANFIFFTKIHLTEKKHELQVFQKVKNHFRIFYLENTENIVIFKKTELKKEIDLWA